MFLLPWMIYCCFQRLTDVIGLILVKPFAFGAQNSTSFENYLLIAFSFAVVLFSTILPHFSHEVCWRCLQAWCSQIRMNNGMAHCSQQTAGRQGRRHTKRTNTKCTVVEFFHKGRNYIPVYRCSTLRAQVADGRMYKVYIHSRIHSGRLLGA